MKTYTFISDSGHGWLKVPYNDVKACGALSEISGYSYISKDAKFLYLEEDHDATIFLTASRLLKDGKPNTKMLTINENNINGQSTIRKLERFEGEFLV